jgi:Zn-finger nucleic acid-binding protein
MAYRDRPATCPRCSHELSRRRRRDIWQCAQCRGVHLAMPELERWVQWLAPDISHQVMAAARAELLAARGDSRLMCPTCQRSMRALVVAGVGVFGCDATRELWLDGDHLGRLLESVAHRQRGGRSWLARLMAHLFVS